MKISLKKITLLAFVALLFTACTKAPQQAEDSYDAAVKKSITELINTSKMDFSGYKKEEPFNKKAGYLYIAHVYAENALFYLTPETAHLNYLNITMADINAAKIKVKLRILKAKTMYTELVQSTPSLPKGCTTDINDYLYPCSGLLMKENFHK